MDIQHVQRKFECMGARVRAGAMPNPGPWGSPRAFSVDVARDRKGEVFEILARADVGVEATVLDVQPGDRHLLLMVKAPPRAPRRRGQLDTHKFLCGHDERAWFVAGVPGGASTVGGAMEALKPPIVRQAQTHARVKTKARNKRRNAGFIRQGEWFFVPRPDLEVDEMLVLHHEPLRRGRGKPHMAQFLFRRGGTTVYVCGEYPNGLTEAPYRRLIQADAGKKRLDWRVMRRNPGAFVKGRITHPDHKTVVLRSWHQVVPNAESTTPSAVNVAFLD